MSSVKNIAKSLSEKRLEFDSGQYPHIGRKGRITFTDDPTSNRQYKKIGQAARKLCKAWEKNPEQVRSMIDDFDDTKDGKKFEILKQNIGAIKTEIETKKAAQKNANHKVYEGHFRILGSIFNLFKRAFAPLRGIHFDPKDIKLETFGKQPVIYNLEEYEKAAHEGTSTCQKLFKEVPDTHLIDFKDRPLVVVEYENTDDKLWEDLIRKAVESGELLTIKYFIVLDPSKEKPQLFFMTREEQGIKCWLCEDFSKSAVNQTNPFNDFTAVRLGAEEGEEVLEFYSPAGLEMKLLNSTRSRRRSC